MSLIWNFAGRKRVNKRVSELALAMFCILSDRGRGWRKYLHRCTARMSVTFIMRIGRSHTSNSLAAGSSRLNAVLTPVHRIRATTITGNAYVVKMWGHLARHRAFQLLSVLNSLTRSSLQVYSQTITYNDTMNKDNWRFKSKLTGSTGSIITVLTSHIFSLFVFCIWNINVNLFTTLRKKFTNIVIAGPQNKWYL
jgi:hypothetical protein